MSDGSIPQSASDQEISEDATPQHVRPSMERWQATFNVVVAIVFFGVFAAAVIAATGYNPSGRRVPILLLTPMTVLSFAMVLTEYRRLRAVRAEHEAWDLRAEPAAEGQDAAEADDDADPSGRHDIYAVLWLAVFTVLVVALGALLGTFVFSLIFLTRRGETKKMTLIYAVSVPIVLHVIFGVLLNVRSYRGFLGWI